jgi:hypothetical protein
MLAGTLAVAAVPVAAQQTGYYGGTGAERKFAREFYESEQEKGIEYVSVSFRLATLTLYPTEELYRMWVGDEEKTKEALGAYARQLLVPVRDKKSRGTVKITVRVRYPNARRSYDRLIATLTSTEGLDGELELEVKGEH